MGCYPDPADMKEDDLYARYQTLAALINVLLHDLRNPLHSATLLVEAMGSRTADIEALRGKLRGQFGKLEGLIAESADSIKELALDAKLEEISVDELVRWIAKDLPGLIGSDVELVDAPELGVRVSVDRTLLLRAVAEISATLAERARAMAEPPPRIKIPLTANRPDATHVRIVVGDWTAPLDDAALKAPFAIAGGGIRLALGRALAHLAGATLRLEQSPEGAIRYAIFIPEVR